MKGLLVATMVMFGLLGTTASTSAEPEYLVYRLSASIHSVGPRFGEDASAVKGYRVERWFGHLLYDCNSNLGILIFGTVRDGRRIYDVIEPEQTLLRYNVEYHPGAFQNVFGSLSGEDGGQFPNNKNMRTIYLLGNRTVFWPIGALTEQNELVRKHVSPRISGYITLLDSDQRSYRLMYVSGRYDDYHARFANTRLDDYNNDGFEDIEDLFEFWEGVYFDAGYLPVND